MATRRLELGFDSGTVLRLTVEAAVSDALTLLLKRRKNRNELADELRGELWTVSLLLDLR